MTQFDLPKGLIYVCDEEPGLTRKRRGRGFVYIDSEGNRLEDKEMIERIKRLAIPPAWKDVWICSKANGYLQATGRDDKLRKQYRYHPDWEIYSNTTKFTHIVDFADQLPELRRRYEKDLKNPEWNQRKVLALATALMDELLLRVGNSCYSEANKTFGLTTLPRPRTMQSSGLSPRVAAALYSAAGALFVIGAFSSGRPAFSLVGLAFIALGVMIHLRGKRNPD